MFSVAFPLRKNGFQNVRLKTNKRGSMFHAQRDSTFHKLTLTVRDDCQEDRLQGSGMRDRAWRVLSKKGKYGLGNNE